MRKSGKLKKFFSFKPYECAAVEEFLTEMALEGWMIESFKGAFFTFHKIEPKKLTFAVDIFDKASEFDTKLADTTLEYIDYCKEAGWQFICSRGKIQIFFTENEKEIPIHTDPALKLKSINKGMLLSYLLSSFLIILSGILCLFSNIQWGFSRLVSNYSSLVVFLFWIFIIMFNLNNIVDYGFWLLRATKKIKAGEDFNYNSKKKKRRKEIFQIAWIIFQTVILLAVFIYDIHLDYSTKKLGFLLGSLTLILITTVAIYLYFKNKNHSRSSNIAFTIGMSALIFYLIIGWAILSVISGIYNHPNSETITVAGEGDVIFSTFTLNHDLIPITIEDLGIKSEGYRDSCANISGTFLAQNYDYTDNYFLHDYDTHKGINYSVFTSPYHWIIDKCLQTKLTNHFKYSYEKVVADKWGANSVYIYKFDNKNSIIVVYNNKILEFESDIVLKENDINLIREKLDLTN
jgi:hypothetical protein